MSQITLEGYDPMDPAVQQDPFPYYAALRDQAPVHRSPRGMFYVSRHDAVVEVLKQPRLFSSELGPPSGAQMARGAEDEIQAVYRDGYPPISTMLTLDPPLQTRYRKTVGRAFSTRRIEEQGPRIRELTRELLGTWPRAGRVDVPRQLSVPLPVRVIALLLGIPLEREADIKRWSDDSVAAIGVAISRERGLEAARGIVEMQHALVSLLEQRRVERRDDFMSDLIDAEFVDAKDRTRKLEIPELLSILQQLMVAGNETTTKAINEIMKLLVENPVEWKRLTADPERIPRMVEEGLRLASPNQGLFRRCTADTELAGTKLPLGATLWVMFGSANRDERVFPDPDRFDPDRVNLSESLTFGYGAHFCLGAPLARLELRVLFEELTRRVESMRFAPGTKLVYEPSYILRGLEALELEVRCS